MQSEEINNPFPDFSEEGTWLLFIRKVIIINDTLKINYGKNFESCPKLLIKHYFLLNFLYLMKLYKLKNNQIHLDKKKFHYH